MVLTNEEVLLLKIKVAKTLENDTLFTDEELLSQLNTLEDDEQQEAICTIFYNIENFDNLHNLNTVISLQNFIDKISYLKLNSRVQSNVDYLFLELKSDNGTIEENKEYFSKYIIRQNNNLNYYSLLISIFIRYQLFDRLDEIENIIKSLKL